MTDELPQAIEAELARADVWDDPPPGLEDAIVAAIASEPVPIDTARPARRRLPGWLSAAAAIAAIAAGAAIVATVVDDEPDDELAGNTSEASLTGTDLAPDATATALFTPTPAGLKILLDADGLAGAGADEMYEAWISDGTLRVSAGTFHLRNGDEPIELWAGTDDPRFTVITVTVEPIDGVAESSGEVVLRGAFSLPGAELKSTEYTGS
jgi:hypothetical protein